MNKENITDDNENQFDFTLYLYDGNLKTENIIVQRNFLINYFNERAINSLNFKETIDHNVWLIQTALYINTVNYMSENVHLFDENPHFADYNINTNNDIMKYVVRRNGRVIAYREFDPNGYLYRIRGVVDIRSEIYSMINRIQKTLSERDRNLETTYLGKPLIPYYA